MLLLFFKKGPKWRVCILTVWRRRVPLDGSDRVSIVWRDVVPLSIDIKEYIRFVNEGILRRVHVWVAEARVMWAGMLLVQHRGMMAHPSWLIRTYFHRFFSLYFFLNLCLSLCFFVFLFSLNVHARRSNKSHKDTRNKISPKSVFLSLLRLNPQVPRLFPITWRRERAELLSYILTD